MRTVPDALAARLSGSATTLAIAFLVTRRDGMTLGFTDHDRPLTVKGVACLPDRGLSRSVASYEASLAAGEEEVSGALSAEALTPADLAAGLWDGADVEVHLVDWEMPSLTLALRRARIGEVVSADGRFRAELRGPAALLAMATGRRLLPTCDAMLGDARCGKDLALLTDATQALAGATADRLRLAPVPNRPDDWYIGGHVLLGDGQRRPVVSVRLADGALLVGLDAPPVALPAAGATVFLVAGCDKRLDTCRRRFANVVNFRGFPHMPGRDAAFSYARDGGRHDGGSLFR